MKHGFVLGLCVFMIACGTTRYNAVVVRDVPHQPVFVVQPPNNRLYQAWFANEVEHALISAGVKVVMPPQKTKDVTVTKSIGAVEAAMHVAAIRAGAGTITESYDEYEDVGCDYFVRTFAIERHIKIIRTFDREVVALVEVKRPDNNEGGLGIPPSAVSTVVPWGVKSPWQIPLYQALKAMGIPLGKNRFTR